MSTTVLTEEQKEWVDEVTHVLTTTAPSLGPATSRAPHFSRLAGAIEPATSRSTDAALSRREQGEKNDRLTTQSSSALEKSRRERRRALILPREHGAWGLLLVPMVTATGVAFRVSFRVVPVLLMLTAALALFWLRTPFESLLGTSALRAQSKDERRLVVGVIAVLGTIATAAVSTLLWAGRNPLLWLIGAGAGLAFAGQSLLKLTGRRAPNRRSAQRLRMFSEIVGTIGLTSSAPASYYVITGNFNSTAWILWLANMIFAGNQIHYVQLRIHSAKLEGLREKLSCGWTFALGQALMTAVITVACLDRLMPQYASLAFAPIMFRGWLYFIQKPMPLKVRNLGWGELGQAVLFCVAFIGSFTLAK